MPGLSTVDFDLVLGPWRRARTRIEDADMVGRCADLRAARAGERGLARGSKTSSALGFSVIPKQLPHREGRVRRTASHNAGRPGSACRGRSWNVSLLPSRCLHSVDIRCSSPTAPYSAQRSPTAASAPPPKLRSSRSHKTFHVEFRFLMVFVDLRVEPSAMAGLAVELRRAPTGHRSRASRGTGTSQALARTAPAAEPTSARVDSAATRVDSLE